MATPASASATATDESHATAAQREELSRARDMDSDLELAYRLQMAEAVAASLKLQPSSSPHSSTVSSSSSTPLPPPPPTLPGSSPSLPAPNADNDTSRLGPAVELLEEDLDRLERERRDRDLSEAEARKMRLDLSRRVHDQMFAREINSCPPDEWEEFGDFFEKPFEEGSSSSFSSRSETYRLYFKGLVSEERVKDSNINISGVGIAICDPSDSLIFEVTKPFKEPVPNQRVAEFKALIEGLQIALSLDLKRILIFCDYYPLFQFITHRWNPKQQQILALMRNVTVLRSNFKYCQPVLVSRQNIKYAFRLARDAIISQMDKVADSYRVDNLSETCAICLEETDTARMFSVSTCFHRYCFTCMKQHVEVKILHGMIPKCPHDGCKSELSVTRCERFLTPKLISMMKLRIKEASIPVTEKVYCPNPQCSALMSKSEASDFAKIENVRVRAIGGRKCMNCNRLFCMNCKVPWHYNLTCTEYKRRNPMPEDTTIKTLARKNLWRQCNKCNHMIELAEGCFHMTCRCGHEFCYTCGAEWKSVGREKKPTCSCPLFDDELTEEDDEDYLSDFDDDELIAEYYGEFDDEFDTDEDELY